MRRCPSPSSARSFWNSQYMFSIQQSIQLLGKDRVEQKKEVETRTNAAPIIGRVLMIWFSREIDHEVMGGEDVVRICILMCIVQFTILELHQTPVLQSSHFPSVSRPIMYLGRLLSIFHYFWLSRDPSMSSCRQPISCDLFHIFLCVHYHCHLLDQSNALPFYQSS
jgi:hypothetical protein